MSGYSTNDDLPASVRKLLDPDAQDVYRVAFNSATAGGRDKLEATHDAWEAIGRGWRLEKGRWVKREEIVQ